MNQVDLHSIIPNLDGIALDFLGRLIQFDPDLRPTCEQALEHPYLESYHNAEDEPGNLEPLEFGFEDLDDIEDLRDLISKEIVDIFNRKNSRKKAIQ